MARIDLGDVVLDLSLTLKGRPHVIWHVGAPRKSPVAHRIPRPVTPSTTPRKVTAMADLKADNEFDLSVQFEDEMENPVPAPDGATTVYTQTDGAEFVTLADHGDGTATVTALGPLGNSTVHSVTTVDFGNGPTEITGDFLVSVVAGDAQRVRIVAGPAREVTPDA